MAMIRQHDKRSGIAYAQASRSYWDPEKKMSRAKRKRVGRIDPETGEIVPADGVTKSRKKRKNLKIAENSINAMKKLKSKETLIASLKAQIRELTGNE